MNEQEPEYSRRQFFRKLLLPEIGKKKELVTAETSTVIFDNLVEKLGEGAALFVIMATAYEGSRKKSVFYTVDSEAKQNDLDDFDRKLGLLKEFGYKFGNLNEALSALYSSWRNSYLKEDESCVPDSDGEGETCSTYFYFNDGHMKRRFGLDHSVIEVLLGLSRHINQTIKRDLPEVSEQFDLSRGENSLFYQENIRNMQTGRIEAVFLYGLVGVAFLLYEEVINGLSRSEKLPKLPLIESNNGIKRRTFLKLIGAFVGGYYLDKLQRTFASKNSQLLERIKTHAKSVVNKMNTTPDANFERYFGYNLEKMVVSLTEFRNKLSLILSSGYNGEQFLFWTEREWPEVKEQIQNCLKETEELLLYLEETFPFRDGLRQIPNDLTTVTQSIWATREIQGYVQGQATEVHLQHFINAVLLGLGLAGWAYATERFIIPATNKQNTEEELLVLTGVTHQSPK